MKQKYYLRGLGFGILITALVFVFAGPSEMSEEEIIKYAEQLGYVKEEESAINLKGLLSETPEPTPTPTIVPEPTETPVPTETPAVTPEPTLSDIPEPSITEPVVPTETPVPTLTPTATPAALETTKITVAIVVERGNTASVVCRKIEEAGILEDGDLLKNYLTEHNLTDYINIGTYSLSNEMTVKEIAAILTGR